MTNYSPIKNVETINDILHTIYNHVCSCGGDGDALWYSERHHINDIKVIVDTYNSKLPFPWEVKLEDNFLSWGHNQEWVIITNDKTTLLNAPHWISFKLQY